MTILGDTLGRVRPGEAVHFQGLTMFPLVGNADRKPDYRMLDDALGDGSVTIGEVSEGGTVPVLRLENRGTRPVLLLDGEQLVGAKQNRVLNLTILAPAGKTIDIPVSCVEQGRWSFDSPQFMSSERVMFSRGRASKAASVSASMYEGRGRNSDQGEVWDAIAMKSERMASFSPTAAMERIYVDHGARLDDYLEQFPVQAGQCGAVFAVGGRVVGFDLFDAADTYARLGRKLLSGYAMDAMEAEPDAAPAADDSAAGFLERVAACETRAWPAVGLGEDLRYSGQGLAVAALARDGEAVHVCAFALAEGDSGSAGFSRASARAQYRRR